MRERFEDNTFGGTWSSQFPLDVLARYSMYNHMENIGYIPFWMLGVPNINSGLDCMNYGGIGLTLGSLLAMPFDEAGRKIDSCGNKRNWWEESTLQEFNNRAMCFDEFYSKFTVNGREIKMDGNCALDSNIVHNVGMELVLSAYEKYINDYGTESKLICFEGYSSEQLLTVVMANTMCLSLSQDAYYEKFEKNIHSIPYLRTNGIFMNSKKMLDIWGCPEESRMNPKDKCYIF